MNKQAFNSLTSVIKTGLLPECCTALLRNTLISAELISETENNKFSITELGKKALEPYRIKTAVIIAAGMGTRLRPITLETPKPLVSVCGVPIIETIIQALIKQNIERIFVTVGYKKEKYAYLEQKYNGLKLIENTYYTKYQTISSFYSVRDYIGEDNFVLCEGDMRVINPDAYEQYVYRSSALVLSTPPQTYEWGYAHDEAGKISTIIRPGSGIAVDNTMCSVTYLLKEDAQLIKQQVIKTFEKGGCEGTVWDECANELYPMLDAQIKIVPNGSIMEIDTVEDLVKQDPSYAKYLEEAKKYE